MLAEGCQKHPLKPKSQYKHNKKVYLAQTNVRDI